MAYLIFVNPSMLADAGMPREAAIAATVWSAVAGSLLMGLWVNFPIALAPGMGINAFFAYYVCGVHGLHWTVALGAVFFSGVVFLLLTVTHIREMIIEAVPLNIKYAIVVGIGMFISLIGLRNAGIVVASETTLVTLGSLTKPEPLLACLGMFLTVALMARRVQGAILVGLIATTVIGMFCGVTPLPTGIDSIVTLDVPSVAPVFMKLDIMGAVQYGIVSIVLTFTVVELFDNMGTLIGLCRKAGLMDDQGRIRHLGRALTADSIGAISSSVIGTTTVISYVENASGISQGGRTGLTAVTVAGLFALSLLFAPLIGLVPSCATAPALLIVGMLMMTDVIHIDFGDVTEAFPAFMTIIAMPMTYSIASGFGFGFVSHAAVKLISGRAREVRPITWIIAAVFAVNFVMRG